MQIPRLPETVSRETELKLQTYMELLRKWQQKINLVSKATLDDVWNRHFSDSLQLSQMIPNKSRVFDLGSGAGFPGLVLAIARPDLEIHLIESDQKKCSFQKTVSRETNANSVIHNARIEDVFDKIDSVPDIITARALASLNDLLQYCQPWMQKNPDLEMLFLKGAQYLQEVEEAQKKYDFEISALPSITSSEGYILHLKDVHKKA